MASIGTFVKEIVASVAAEVLSISAMPSRNRSRNALKRKRKKSKKSDIWYVKSISNDNVPKITIAKVTGPPVIHVVEIIGERNGIPILQISRKKDIKTETCLPPKVPKIRIIRNANNQYSVVTVDPVEEEEEKPLLEVKTAKPAKVELSKIPEESELSFLNGLGDCTFDSQFWDPIIHESKSHIASEINFRDITSPTISRKSGVDLFEMLSSTIKEGEDSPFQIKYSISPIKDTVYPIKYTMSPTKDAASSTTNIVFPTKDTTSPTKDTSSSSSYTSSSTSDTNSSTSDTNSSTSDTRSTISDANQP